MYDADAFSKGFRSSKEFEAWKQQQAETADKKLRNNTISRGYVPVNCLASGIYLYTSICNGEDPCASCDEKRSVCNGRSKRITK